LPADLTNRVTKVSLFIDVLAVADLLGVVPPPEKKKEDASRRPDVKETRNAFRNQTSISYALQGATGVLWNGYRLSQPDYRLSR